MNKLIVPAVIVAAGMVGGLCACGPVIKAAPTTPIPPASVAMPTPTAATAAPAPTTSAQPPTAAPTASARLLPHAALTPGAVNPAVTQGNIYSTICRKGWTATIRPPESYTEALTRTQLTEYGHYDGSSLGNYEEDHLIPLELGGSPASAKNLWPESHPASYTKDGVEDTLNHAVCDGQVKLVPAQNAIATNWMTAETDLGLKWRSRRTTES
jgi:hypothetical protein